MQYVRFSKKITDFLYIRDYNNEHNADVISFSNCHKIFTTNKLRKAFALILLEQIMGRTVASLTDLILLQVRILTERIEFLKKQFSGDTNFIPR